MNMSPKCKAKFEISCYMCNHFLLTRHATSIYQCSRMKLILYCWAVRNSEPPKYSLQRGGLPDTLTPPYMQDFSKRMVPFSFLKCQHGEFQFSNIFLVAKCAFAVHAILLLACVEEDMGCFFLEILMWVEVSELYALASLIIVKINTVVLLILISVQSCDLNKI